MFLIMLKGHCQGKKKCYSCTCVSFVNLSDSEVLEAVLSLLCSVFFCIFSMVDCSPVVLAFVSTHFQVLFLPSK